MEPLAPADAHRIYLSDPTHAAPRRRPHPRDRRRRHEVPGHGRERLRWQQRRFARPQDAVRGHDYLSRLQRGTRTDVIEAYDTGDLSLRYEIEIPAKHAQSLPIKALTAATGDGRFLLVQNATPATSITVVDLAESALPAKSPTPAAGA
jgi:methylamine dehydrogenase heavy chain